MSDSNPSLTVPDPGWYPDRNDPKLMRWWDGGQWTENTHSLAPETPLVEQPVSVAAFGISAPAATQEAASASAAASLPAFSRDPQAASSASIPPGWYPDHRDASLQRWWDGRAWTAHTAPRMGGTAPAYGAAQIGTTNSAALTGFIFSVVSVVINPFLGLSIVGLILGVRGLRRAPQFAPQNARRGLSIAAIIIGAVSTLLSIFWVVAAVQVYEQTHQLMTSGSSAIGTTASGSSGTAGSTDSDAATSGQTIPYTVDMIRQDIADDFTQRYQATVSHVDCPSDASTAPSASFDCTVGLSDGRTGVVDIEMDQTGGYTLRIVQSPAGQADSTDPDLSHS